MGGMVPSCLQDQLHLSLSLRAEIRCKEWNYKGPEPEIEQESHEHTHGKTCCSSDPSESGCMRSDLRKWDQWLTAPSAATCWYIPIQQTDGWTILLVVCCLFKTSKTKMNLNLDHRGRRGSRKCCGVALWELQDPASLQFDPRQSI